MGRKNPESKIKEEVLRYLSSTYPGYWMKNHGNLFQKGGRPDIEGCYKGIFVAIELKKDSKEGADPRQEYWLKQIAEAGGIALGQVYSTDILGEMIERALETKERLKMGVYIHP